MKHFQAKEWELALSLLSKKIMRWKKKYGQEKRHCEILVFAAISHLEMSNEKSVQAFCYLKKAINLNTCEGIKLTKDILSYHVRLLSIKNQKYNSVCIC